MIFQARKINRKRDLKKHKLLMGIKQNIFERNGVKA
jgi:hypothetical protein